MKMNMTVLEIVAFEAIARRMSDYEMSDLMKAGLGQESYFMGGEHNYCEIEDIASECEISVSSAKGVLGSLAKKGYVWCDEDDTYDGMFCPTIKGAVAFVEDIREYRRNAV